jgi:rRNA processing protein Krr1/Pno1
MFHCLPCAGTFHHTAHVHRSAAGVQIPVPQNRMTPLKTAWMQLYTPITDNLKLDMRMNLKTKKVRTTRLWTPTLPNRHILYA